MAARTWFVSTVDDGACQILIESAMRGDVEQMMLLVFHQTTDIQSLYESSKTQTGSFFTPPSLLYERLLANILL